MQLLISADRNLIWWGQTWERHSEPKSVRGQTFCILCPIKQAHIYYCQTLRAQASWMNMSTEWQHGRYFSKCHLLIDSKHPKAHSDCVANTAGWACVVTARPGIMEVCWWLKEKRATHTSVEKRCTFTFITRLVMQHVWKTKGNKKHQ